MIKSQQGLVITVNERDEWTGTMEKMKAHTDGVLHRAFSVFILNEHNEMLLQRRATGKYHSGGLWTNTCCSHPAPGESTINAAHRRLMEEMGFDCALEPCFHLRYKADVGNSLTENEYDHIYIGRYDGKISPDPDEVMDYKYVPVDEVIKSLNEQAQDYTAWFRLAMPKFMEYIPILK